MKNQHRLICLAESPACLMAFLTADITVSCDGGNDKYSTQLKWILDEHQCKTPNSIECNSLKTYIQSPSSLLLTNNNTVLEFRQYCNNIWELPRGFDESLCEKWRCPKEQYQCLTGHCTVPTRILGGNDRWTCPDGSDSIDLLRFAQLSERNVSYIGQSYLNAWKIIVSEHNKPFYNRSSTTPCNSVIEYRCLLANVSDPLNFTINRPCINKTQIGDGVINCYGGLDERDLLTCGNNVHEQRGFDFHCDDEQCIPYHRHCEQRCSNKADSLLCDQLPTLWNSQYPNFTRERVCASSGLNNISDKLFYCDERRPGGK